MNHFNITRNYFINQLWMVFILVGHLNIAGLTETIVVNRGGDLELRCNHGDGYTWWIDGRPLLNNTSLANNTIILRLHNVTLNNQGVYWCGSSWQHGTNVSVIIGDPPSKARNLYTSSFEWDKVLHWTASEATGGLPVHYTVKIHPLNQTDDTYTVDTFAHRTDKKYSCSLPMAELDKRYQACVDAINELGKSSSCIYFKRPDLLVPSDTIPGPPLYFRAYEVRQGEVRLSWQQRNTWDGRVDIFIWITYSNSGDRINKTLAKIPVKRTKQQTKIIRNLHADRSYTFYAESQYYTPNMTPSNRSTAAVATLHTKYTVPDHPPQHLRCNASMSNSDGKRNITLSWQPPAPQYRNGPLTKYDINVYISNQQSFNRTVDAPATSVVFPLISDSEDVRMSAVVCNKGNYCSGISDSCTVHAGIVKHKIPPTFNLQSVLVTVPSVIGGILIITFLYYVYRRRNTPRRRCSSSTIPFPTDLQSGQYVGPYQDVAASNESTPELYAIAFIEPDSTENMEIPFIPQHILV